MIFKPRSTLAASMSCWSSKIKSSIGRVSSKRRGSDDLVLASASQLRFCSFMRLVCLVCGFHRQACPLGSQTTNRIFNYPRDIAVKWRAMSNEQLSDGAVEEG